MILFSERIDSWQPAQISLPTNTKEIVFSASPSMGYGVGVDNVR